MATKPKVLNSMAGGGGDWIVPALAVSMVFVMLIPLPALALDLLLRQSEFRRGAVNPFLLGY